MFKKKRKKNKRIIGGARIADNFRLPKKTMRWIYGVLMLLITIITILSFFNKAGVAGRVFIDTLSFLIGKTTITIPLILLVAGFTFFLASYKRVLWPVILAIFLLILGISGFLGTFNPEGRLGGWFGHLVSVPFLKFFDFWATQIIFGAIVFVGGLILLQLLFSSHIFKREENKKEALPEEKKNLISKILSKVTTPKFKIKEIEPSFGKSAEEKIPAVPPELKAKPVAEVSSSPDYKFPPLDLLEPDRENPSSGDTRVNSAIIKKTLQNFDIPVEMSEINIGPTVTQYTLKPAEGIKLSKITGLSNDLALALASHPIRIEAPIPGRSLVGVEVPNKVRARVRIRNLIENPNFGDPKMPQPGLKIALGRDVAGIPFFASLGRMPHLLVAGSTGTGKTIFLNSLVLSLLYQNSPKNLRFILVDPKRVEFPVYNGLPHLLCPVIYDTTRTVNALKWTIGEMERRFGVLSEAKARDILTYNETALRQNSDPLPYIVLIIDELADLMAAKGREMEAGIVRLAQMARAVGIHLVVATQRPSVEVITGLIKANITSRITFQVASQVDSRTVIDTAGAEKLLGLGDMLFISAEFSKPKRIQGAYVSEKEVKRVTEHIKSNAPREMLEEGAGDFSNNETTQSLEETLEVPEPGLESFFGGDDPLYEDAKRVVIEYRKASASLLQRRLRIGYARAARLIDILEEKGVVGPGEGAKPREVFIEEKREDNLF